jgi:hypothetical protein
LNINSNVETVEKHAIDDPNAYLHVILLISAFKFELLNLSLYFIQNENFMLNAFYMERLLNQNTYQPRQARYRGLTPLDEG